LPDAKFTLIITVIGVQLFIVLTEITAGETQGVKDPMLEFGFLGMKFLIFDFDGDILKNPYVPNNHVENYILYIRIHACNTVLGWFEERFWDEEEVKLEDILGKKLTQIQWLKK
jgi:4-alpha-glucanotransferase